MRYLLVMVLLLSGCGEAANITPYKRALTFDEIRQMQLSCTRRDEQLNLLRISKTIKGLDNEPDNLNDDDRAYNSRLKASMWWLEMNCGDQK